MKLLILSVVFACVAASMVADDYFSPRGAGVRARQLRLKRHKDGAERRRPAPLKPFRESAELPEIRRREDVGPLLVDTLHNTISERSYGPPIKHHHKCHPQTLTKYNTIYKERKANVYNKVEVRNPRPQVHKTKETRHTTIRYPIFITQVIKPLLTQVETKVKPVFFTKTLKRIKTILFTVTGIGQVTVTSVKYEKEYVTRCNKKAIGYHGGLSHGGHHLDIHHRKDDVNLLAKGESQISEDRVDLAQERLDDYGEIYEKGSSRTNPLSRYRRDLDLSPSIKTMEVDDSQINSSTLPLDKITSGSS